MTEYIVNDLTDGTREVFYRAADAKSHMRSLVRLGHEYGSCKFRIYANGDSVNCGPIRLTGRNSTLVVGATRQTKPSY